MKLTNYVLLLCLLLLPACSKDDVQTDNRPVLSYFSGYISDEQTTYEQKDVWDHAFYMSSCISIGSEIMSITWRMILEKENKDSIYIRTTLAPLKLALYELTPLKDQYYEDFYSEINVFLYNSADKKEYIVSEHKPFHISIISIDRTGISPGVTGVLEGTLYNKVNPKDSIVFKDARFRLISR